MKGLAHAHVHDIGDFFPIGLKGDVVDDPHLVDDLAMRKIAEVPHFPGCTEGASEHAADLRGNADGKAVGGAVRVEVGDQHGLHFVVVGVIEAKQKLQGAIGGLLLLVDGYGSQYGIFGQAGTELFGKVGHLVEGARTLLVKPLENLISPVRVKIEVGQPLMKLFF